MKKIVFGILFFVVVLSVGLYYYRERTAGPDELAQVDEVLKNSDSEADPSKKVVQEATPSTPSDSNKKNENRDDLAKDMLGSGGEETNPQNEKSLNQDEADKMTAYFEATEKAWDERMEHLIIDEMHLPMSTLKEYKVLRDGFDRDKMEAFEDFHKHMREQYGDGYSYNPTKDEEKFANKVKDQYDARMRKLLGQEHYLQYREVLSEFNKKLKAEQNPEIGVRYMDL